MPFFKQKPLAFEVRNMPAERYFLDHPLKVHDRLELKGSEFHHLAHVMRTRKGEVVEIVNGKGALARAAIQEISKEQAVLKIEHVEEESERPCGLILAQAIPKLNRLDFILEKGTELGVDDFWIFPGEESVKKEISQHQLERFHALLIAAMKQCGRLTLPKLTLQPPLEQWSFPADMSLFFGDLESGAPSFKDIWKKQPHPVVFVTGPEAGFSKREERILRSLGAIGVKLHPHILRTDTASLMALSLLSHWMFT
jgi:16S rRNA (uracil1498-N3)-methyltransferase